MPQCIRLSSIAWGLIGKGRKGNGQVPFLARRTRTIRMCSLMRAVKGSLGHSPEERREGSASHWTCAVETNQVTLDRKDKIRRGKQWSLDARSKGSLATPLKRGERDRTLVGRAQKFLNVTFSSSCLEMPDFMYL
jgi:hypothetical protein